ncbi:hypothetical protein DAPPUDRAFT_331210 [Daphnia pulex]|uniref:Uncharacterized protein n=1 Tax=Daphnia pulex TaxID=6669 RepID=E9HLT7_DAPPU|nr:hypothetical protein DAPPUDRAFT_331210 [Daphnia pulex]|eukprot:EFX67301.1 hypothetical protein DAPPUDRAFT_331210 [Daphnia pulex]
MDQSTEEQWECVLKMNPKWTQICITCLEQRPETNDKSNDSPQEYFKFFVEAAFTGNVPSSEDGDDEGEEESEHESGSDETKVDETKGLSEEKAERDHEKGAEGEEQVAKIEEPVAEPAAGPILSRKRRLARKAKRNTKKFNLEEDFKKYCSASDTEEEENLLAECQTTKFKLATAIKVSA